MSGAMSTVERAFGIEVSHVFGKERAGDVEVANGFVAKERAGDAAEVAANGFIAKGRACDVEVANGFVVKETAVDVEVTDAFTAEERACDVEVANGIIATERDGDDVVATNGFVTKERRTGDDAEVAHDFSPLLVVYKSGRLERPLILPLVPPGHDDATGVVSKDVPLSASSFARLYLPPEARRRRRREGQAPRARLLPRRRVPATCVYHRFLNDLAAACPAVAVSVDYRLAPEHLLPAAYEDSLAALKWVFSAADPWLAAHGDPGSVFLAGDSAGGNICHHLAMHPDVRAAGLKGIVLIHPWFWGKEPIAGELEHRSPVVGSSRMAKKKSLWEYVCPDAADGVDDPRMNPTAPGLENLACEKVMVCVAEGDHLRWRGKAYAADAAARAKANGSEPSTVEMFESMGVGHVFYLLDPDMDEARELLSRIAGFVNPKLTSERAAAAAASLTIE
ncbi:hypothetical protein EJB05_37795, partial [Eragrostis curvula]